MSKRRFHQDDFSHQASAEQDVVALIKRMQQQLAFLEKKLDILINQSHDKPSGERHFSKPFRASGPPHRHAGGGRDAGYGEKRFDRGRRFEKRHGENDHAFGHNRKSYDDVREGEGAPEHYFEKRRDGATREFRHKKKSFYKRRKDGGSND
jgi:hypothetical protein